MIEEIKQRIETINKGEVPDGYIKTEVGIVPNSVWEVKRVSDVSSIVGGGTPKTNCAAYWNGSIPWISINDFKGSQRFIYSTEKTITDKGLSESSTRLLKKGNLIISARGTVGELGQIATDMAFNQSCFGIIADKNTTDNYLYYGLKITLAQVQSKIGGAVFDTIVKKTFDELFVAIPLLIEQEKIANILIKWDEAVSLQENLIEKLEIQRKALIQKLLAPKDGWKKVQLADLGTTFGGLSGKSKDDFGKGKPYISYMNIFSNCIIDTDCFEYVTIKDDEYQNKAKYGDVFFTTSSETPEEVGMASVLLSHIEDLYLNSFCFFNTLAQGATRFNLSKNTLLKCNIFLPSLPEQTTIAAILSTADFRIGLQNQKLIKLKEQQKSMMQLLLTGIVRV